MGIGLSSQFLELHDYRDGVLVQTISIALLTLFYSLICIVLSIIPIIGYISFDADWNPVILKLAKKWVWRYSWNHLD